MRKAMLLTLGFAVSSLLMRRARQFGPLSAVAVAGVLEEVAKRLRDQALPDQARKPCRGQSSLDSKDQSAKV